MNLKREIITCTKCELHEIGHGPVPFFGKPSDWMILGEAPGRREDEIGRPFVGPAGQLLWQELAKVGLERRDVMRANAVSCWPNGTPSNSQISACRCNLYNQIKHCDPRWILALGLTVNNDLGNAASMSRIHGHWYELPWFENSHRQPIMVMATYHPAAVLRNRTLMRAWREDLRTFVAES